MRIDIIVSSRELFGSDRNAVRVARVLTSLGHEPTLVLPSSRPERGLSAYAAERGVRTVEAGVAIASSRGVEGVAVLMRQMSRRRESKAPLAVYNTSAVLACDRPSYGEVIMLREWLDPSERAHRALAWWHDRRAKMLVAISSDVLSQWRKVARGSAAQRLCWDWLDPQDLSTAYEAARCSDQRAGILCLGRFNGWKGQELLANAFEVAFEDPRNRPKLTFVGAQPGTEFAGLAERLATRGAEHGWEVDLFTNDVTSMLAAASLLVVPSLHPEPFGMVILEALAAGCRVMACDGGGPSDLQPLFPDALSLVTRDPRHLAVNLREWWNAGGSAQSPTTYATTRDVIANSFSEEAARREWQIIIATAAG